MLCYTTPVPPSCVHTWAPALPMWPDQGGVCLGPTDNTNSSAALFAVATSHSQVCGGPTHRLHGVIYPPPRRILLLWQLVHVAGYHIILYFISGKSLHLNAPLLNGDDCTCLTWCSKLIMSSLPHPPKKSGPYPGTSKCYLIWIKGFAEVIK